MECTVTSEDTEYEINVKPVSEKISENRTAEKYPSAAALLEVAKDEYTKERERTNSLDNKASVFIAAIIAIITVFIPLIPFDEIIKVYSTDCKTDLITVSLCVLGAAICFLIFSFYQLYKAFSIREFKRPQINDLHDFEI